MIFFSCEDKEEPRQREVQGSVLALPVHAGHQRSGEGRETQAVAAPRSVVIDTSHRYSSPSLKQARSLGL